MRGCGGHVFLFRSKSGNYLKALHWDGSGLCLFAKRLERNRFVWPPLIEGGVARRKLHDVFKADEHSVARQGLDMVRDLYAIERQIDDVPAEQRRQARMASKAKALEFAARQSG